jgi:glycosyltransferase involved in cell wall biosynthesis
MVAPQPVFQPRGTPFSVVYRIRALCRAGHQVDLVTYPYGRDVLIPGVRILRVPRLPGVANVGIGPSVPKLFLDTFLIVWTAVLLAWRRYDVIWSHEEAGLFCGAFSRLFGIRHIYDMHSDLAQQIQNYARFNRQPFLWLFGLLTRAMVHSSDVVLTICDDLVNTVRGLAPNKRVLLVENYCTEVDFLDDALPTVEELRARHEVNGRAVALYIGSLEPYQGIDILVDAAAHLAERQLGCRMLIVGGQPSQVEELCRTIERRGLSRVVEVVGSVPPGVVEVYINLADMLLTSRSKGTNVPLKLYQYMKSGKPIVATRIESHTQLLDDDTALLTETTGADFGKAIEQLVEHPERAQRLAERAQAKAQAFSNTHFERQINRALRWAIPAGRRAV